MLHFRTRHLTFLAVVGAFLFSCGADPTDPWTDKDLAKYLAQMENAGKAFAVADTCMPMIDADEDARTQVSLEISAKRYSQLLAIDAEERVDEMLAFYENAGGTEDQLGQLESAYRETYDASIDELTSLEVCVQTVINFHNTILNARVRQR